MSNSDYCLPIDPENRAVIQEFKFNYTGDYQVQFTYQGKSRWLRMNLGTIVAETIRAAELNSTLEALKIFHAKHPEDQGTLFNFGLKVLSKELLTGKVSPLSLSQESWDLITLTLAHYVVDRSRHGGGHCVTAFLYPNLHQLPTEFLQLVLNFGREAPTTPPMLTEHLRGVTTELLQRWRKGQKKTPPSS